MAGRQLRKGFKQMQEQMQDQLRAQQMQDHYQGSRQGGSSGSANESRQSRPTSSGKTTSQKEDYIDFEEIKEG